MLLGLKQNAESHKFAMELDENVIYNKARIVLYQQFVALIPVRYFKSLLMYSVLQTLIRIRHEIKCNNSSLDSCI